MWFLKGPKGELIYLKRNSTIVVGRIQGDIVLRDDKSISRSHASVVVQSKGDENRTLCIVKDLCSKYGSSISRKTERIKITEEGIEVQHNDIIKFGLQSNDYLATYIPTVVLISSMNDLKPLYSLINDIDGYVVDEWSNEITHLTTAKAKLGEKIAMALVNCVPIVGIDYWKTVQNAIKNNEDWPKVMDFILPITEDIIDNTKVSLAPNFIRKTLFNNLTFLFFSYSQFRIYKKIIKDAGGKVLMFNKSVHTDLTQFCSDEFVVVYYMIGSNQTEESILDSQNTKAAYEEIEELLRESKRRMISDSEIMLAILHCSLQQNCNAKHNYKEILLEQKASKSRDKKKTNVFALDTEDVRSNSTPSHNENIIAETDDFSQDFGDTEWSIMNTSKKVVVPSAGLSAISAICLDSQETTDDIGGYLGKSNMDQKRPEKRTLEPASSTPAKKAKLNMGSSLFPVFSKKNSQSSQDMGSQNSKYSQLTSRDTDSGLFIDRGQKTTSQSESNFTRPSNSNDSGKQESFVHRPQKTISQSQSLFARPSTSNDSRKQESFIEPAERATSQSQNKFTHPSTSNDSGKREKSKQKSNIFGSWLEKADTSIQEIEEPTRPRKRMETELQTRENVSFEEPEKERNKSTQRIRDISDAFPINKAILERGKKKVELRNQSSMEEKSRESRVDDSLVSEEPKTKKRRFLAENSPSSAERNINEKRNDKRRRDNGSDDSDGNNFVMSKKQNLADTSNLCQIDLSDRNRDEDSLAVTGLIRRALQDISLNHSSCQKTFHKTYNAIPISRISRDVMVDSEIDTEFFVQN